MDDAAQKSSSRRDLLKGIGRYAILAVVAVATGLSCFKRARLNRDGVCINRGLCTGCEVFDDCDLPEAADIRDTLKSSYNG